MNNETQKTVTTDINRDFNRDVNLYNLIGQKKCKKMLLTQLHQFLNDKAEHRNPEIEPILLVGKTATTLARAYSNSFGNSEFFEAESSYFGMGMSSSDFYLQGNEFSTYFLRHIEYLHNWYMNSVVQLIRDKEIHTLQMPGVTNPDVLYYNRLLIFSTQNVSGVEMGIMDGIGVVCHLENYSDSEILEILKQRVNILNWDIEIELLKSIVIVAGGNVDMAIRTLLWTYRAARAAGSDALVTKHLNSALHMLQ